jgi:hypothetical protein
MDLIHPHMPLLLKLHLSFHFASLIHLDKVLAFFPSLGHASGHVGATRSAPIPGTCKVVFRVVHVMDKKNKNGKHMI